jgi:hypothetical protein
MDLNLNQFVRFIKEYKAEQVICEFDFVHEGELYKASIAVKKFEKEQKNDNSEN